ncbi:hypothetical protein JOM56_012999 [Amanita muscaria]
MDTSYQYDFLSRQNEDIYPSQRNDFPTPTRTNGMLPGISQLPAQVETLELPDLLRNQYVRNLHDRVDNLTAQVMELQGRLVQVLERPPQPHYIPHSRIPSSALSTTPGSNGTDGIGPNDSVSVGNDRPRGKTVAPNVRPERYPSSILWTWGECQMDPHAIPSKGKNPSRPAMDRAIQNEDSTEIEKAEWKNILETARLVVNRVLLPLPIPPSLPPTTTRTRSLYRDHYLQKWEDAIDELEQLHPLLTLCANHWKADHTLRCVFNNMSSAESARKRKKAPGSEVQSDLIDEAPGTPQLGPNPEDETQQSRQQPKPSNGSSMAGILASPFGITSPTALNRKRNRVDSNNLQERQTKFQKTGEGEKPLTTTKDTQGSADAPRNNTQLLHVDPSVDNLISIFQADFPQNSFPNHDAALALLQSFKAQPKFVANDPSESLMNLIKETEGADPNDELDEDENGLNWGHRIFSHRLGNLSWQDIGSTVVACRLIAAIVKTCKQARHACAKLGIRGSYISDSYLDRVIDILREKWDEQGSSLNQESVEPMPAQPNQPLAITADGSQSGLVGEVNTDCRDIVSKLKISQMHNFLQKLDITAASNAKKKGISYKATCDDTYTILDLLEKLVPAVAQQPSVLREIEEIVRDNPTARKNTSKKRA